MLALIDLAGLNAFDDGPVAVHPLADVEEHRRIVDRDDLGRHDSRVRTKGLLDQQVDGIRLEDDIVVAQQQERRPLDHGEGLVDRCAEPSCGVADGDEGARCDSSHPGVQGQLRSSSHDQDAQLVIVLGHQRGEGRLEVGIGIRRHNNGHD